jgi:MSHA pilin protein MshC
MADHRICRRKRNNTCTFDQELVAPLLSLGSAEDFNGGAINKCNMTALTRFRPNRKAALMLREGGLFYFSNNFANYDFFKVVHGRKGFTLIELVMVLALIGIIAAFAAPRMGDVTGTKAGAFADKLRADVRYAQNLAMTRNQRHRVYFNNAPAPNPGYAVTDSAAAIVPDPAGGGNLSIALDSGDYTGITAASPYLFIEFDSLGRPYDDAGNPLAAAVNLTISPGPATVSVTPRTGAVN